MMMFRFLVLFLVWSCMYALLSQPSFRFRQQQQRDPASLSTLYVGTTEKPLYDGTNYTFPDTTTSAGIAELLEVSFVNACMQLRTGYVDVLKMFIAAAIAGYELGFPIDDIQKQLSICPKQSANRPLMKEEEDLRYTWYCLVYMVLAEIGHPTRIGTVSESIPKEIYESYSVSTKKIANEQQKGNLISAEELVQNLDSGLSEMERAIRSQSLRVATLTLVVLRESMEAREGGVAPPTPPIEGAFD